MTIISSLALFFAALGSVATAFAAWFIWRQAKLLGIQNQLQSLAQLNEIWESNRMLSLRRRWAENEMGSPPGNGERDLDSLEKVLEFLEEFAGLRQRKVFDDKLIWDTTVGWHAVRYYFYNRADCSIERIREKWKDKTLYQNLRRLWEAYQGVEARERGIEESALIKQMEQTKATFVQAERNASHISGSSD